MKKLTLHRAHRVTTFVQVKRTHKHLNGTKHMKITLNTNAVLTDIVSLIEEQGFTFKGTAYTMNAVGKKKEYDLYRRDKNGKMYYMAARDRSKNTVEMKPKDFTKLSRVDINWL